MQEKEQTLETRIVQAMTELRVILPGAQALFGFQFIGILTSGFERLPAPTKYVHLVSMGLVALSIILLVAPASFHRIAAGGNAEERVLRYTTGMMLPALGLLSAGMIGDAYVMLRRVTQSVPLSAAASGVALVGFAVALYGVPLVCRRRAAKA